MTAASVDLDAALMPWRARYPAVAVKALVVPQSPANALVRISAIASLVILGSHGHGPLAATLLDTTGSHLLHHAACPVMVVHPPSGILP